MNPKNHNLKGITLCQVEMLNVKLTTLNTH